jgi:LmbE family N-acetylglucosaminyl deacetylase
MLTTFNRYLFIGAHPDDIEIWAGGLILRILNENASAIVNCVVLTDGSAGNGSVEIRYDEARRASSMLGVTSYEFVGLKDGSLSSNLELQKILSNLLRKYKPDLLVTHPINDRHPDHAAVGSAIDKALFLSMVSPEFLEYEPHLCKNILRFVSDPFQSPHSKLYVDISDFYEKKKQIIMNFRTQLEVLIPYLQLNELYGKMNGLVACEIFEVETLSF